MKLFAFILVAVGMSALIFFIFNAFSDSNEPLSPIPEDSGVRVIQVTPTP